MTLTTEEPPDKRNTASIDLDARICSPERPDFAFLDTQIDLLISRIPREPGDEGNTPLYRKIYVQASTSQGDIARASLMVLGGLLYTMTQSVLRVGTNYVVATTVKGTGIRYQ
ncbi:hypothetical protein HYW21_08290 [Candidatus Woesearchaeota archaeon]|nr:hypothetical protein [Candidatus Woesearchaeota archaeon]